MLLGPPPPELEDSSVPEGAPLDPDPGIPSKRQPCEHVDQPLVPPSPLPVIDAYDTLGMLRSRPILVREEVAIRLRQAAGALPAPFGLMILDGHRTLDEQRALIDHYGRSGPTEGYVAEVTVGAMRPPHTTGGAVDLTLTWHGTPLALGTDFDDFSPLAHRLSFEGEDGTVRRLRRLLNAALQTAGFTPYPLEWWHWSFGDDLWAAANGRPGLYDTVGRP